MTMLTKLTPEMQAKLAAIRAGREPKPTTQPITTLTKGK